MLVADIAQPHTQVVCVHLLPLLLLRQVRQVYGPDAVATRTAEAFCSAAHVARYGTLPSTTLLALIAARRRQLLAASLARRMSVIAWDDESAASTAAGAPGG